MTFDIHQLYEIDSYSSQAEKALAEFIAQLKSEGKDNVVAIIEGARIGAAQSEPESVEVPEPQEEVIEEEELKNSEHFNIIEAPLVPAETLEKLPMNGKTISFYYKEGAVRGHVKGSIKPWETLLLGLISWDFFVGTDKVYGDRRVTGNPFYTSLKPWNRHSSDMGDFAGFLQFWGWRL